MAENFGFLMVVFDSHSIGKLVVFPHETFLAHIDVVAGYPERCTPFYTKAQNQKGRVYRVVSKSTLYKVDSLN